DFGGAVPPSAVRDVAGGLDIAIVLPEGALGEAEIARLKFEMTQIEDELARSRARLADQAFVSRAPADIVTATRERVDELARKAAVLGETLRSTS
ncbi:MAG: hypothetical protein ACOY3Y_08000, partial [Acidobacteriota bacterium]